MSGEEVCSSSITFEEEITKKPDDRSTHVNLKVKAQDGSEICFRIKRSTKLEKLLNAYCHRRQLHTFRFLFDGRRLNGQETADDLQMVDEDEIDAMFHQSGGAD